VPFNRCVQFLPAFCLLCAIGVSPVHADPIVITGGSMLYPGAMTLQGTQGFSFDGAFGGVVVPLSACFTRCEPGETLPIGTFDQGRNVHGDVTYLGESFRVEEAAGRAATVGGMVVEFIGEAVLPPPGGPTAEVTAPFLFEANIMPPKTSTLPPGTMMGGGLATLTLQQPTRFNVPPGGWEFLRIEYLFIEDPSVVPEPASMLLVGSGLAILFKRRRRRRGSSVS